VGLRAINLKDESCAVQQDIFGNTDYDFKTEQIENSLYKVRQKFGKSSVKRATTV
jgi:hypothetical protein